jgi:hypothetical protein
MFPKEDFLYKNAPKAGFLIGITQILLSGFILKGYANASEKVLYVYKAFKLASNFGFTLGYVSIGVLSVLGVLSILFGFLLWSTNREKKNRYYNILVFLLFAGIIMSFVSVFMFQRLVIYPVTTLPDNL